MRHPCLPDTFPGIAVALGAFPAVEAGGWLEQQTAGTCSPLQAGFVPRQRGTNGAERGLRRVPGRKEVACDLGRGSLWLCGRSCRCLWLGRMRIAGHQLCCTATKPRKPNWLLISHCGRSADEFVAVQLPGEAGTLLGGFRAWLDVARASVAQAGL